MPPGRRFMDEDAARGHGRPQRPGRHGDTGMDVWHVNYSCASENRGCDPSMNWVVLAQGPEDAASIFVQRELIGRGSGLVRVQVWDDLPGDSKRVHEYLFLV